MNFRSIRFLFFLAIASLFCVENAFSAASWSDVQDGMTFSLPGETNELLFPMEQDEELPMEQDQEFVQDIQTTEFIENLDSAAIFEKFTDEFILENIMPQMIHPAKTNLIEEICTATYQLMKLRHMCICKQFNKLLTNENIRRILTTSGFDLSVINQKDSNGHTPLLKAIYTPKLFYRIPALIVAGTDPNAKKNYFNGWSPLHVAVCRNIKIEAKMHLVRMLLYYGANPNARIINNKDKLVGRAPLHLAALYNLRAIIKELILSGANPNLTIHSKDNGRGLAAIHIAAMLGNSEAIEVLVQNGATVSLPVSNPGGYDDGWEAIHHAAASNKVDAILVLQTNGADLNAPVHSRRNPYFEWTPFAIAINNKQRKTINFFKHQPDAIVCPDYLVKKSETCSLQ